MKITPRKGRAGSLVTVYPAAFLVPRERFLWADAALCNNLKSDTARGIFWSLICREHMAGTIADWCSLVGSETKEQLLHKWSAKRFTPALEELAGYGYDVRVDDDGMVTIHRPKVPSQAVKCASLGP